MYFEILDIYFFVVDKRKCGYLIVEYVVIFENYFKNC